MFFTRSIFTGLLLGVLASACAAPSAGTICTQDEDCPEDQHCLTEFKGGYCGLKGCSSDADCPQDTLCVRYDSSTYCFLMCIEKVDCNANRPVDLEANCSANLEPVDNNNSKACVPPTGE